MDKNKVTAIHFARKKNQVAVIEYLTEVGAVNGKTQKPVAAKKDTTKSSQAGGAANDAISRNNMSQSQSALNKRKKQVEKEKTRTACRIVFTDKQGNSRELTTEEWEQFKKNYPTVAGYIENPDSIPREKLENEADLQGWESVAGEIMNNLWRMKGGQYFHKPVDAVRLNIPDYPHVIKNPMDFSTIKKKLSQNVYETI